MGITNGTDRVRAGGAAPTLTVFLTNFLSPENIVNTS